MLPPLLPPQSPVVDDDQSELIEELEKKIQNLTEDLEIEVGNNKVLEQKCEEYLGQLQRSADIIESTKGKQKIQIDNYDDKIQTMEDILVEEKARNEELTIDNERLREEISNFRLAQNGDQNALSKLQEQLEDSHKTMKNLEEQVE